jgi:hypothetical protein
MNMALTYCNSEIAKRRKQVECAICTGTEMTANATNRRLNSCRQSCHFANKHWLLLAHLSPLSPLKLFLSPPLLTERPYRFPGYFYRLIYENIFNTCKYIYQLTSYPVPMDNPVKNNPNYGGFTCLPSSLNHFCFFYLD